MLSKIILFMYKKRIKFYQVLLVIYKRAIRIYDRHENKRGLFSVVKCGIKGFFSIFGLKIVYYRLDKENQYGDLFDAMTVSYDENDRFYYWIDEKIYFNNRRRPIGNMPVDYSLIVDNSMKTIKENIKTRGKNTEVYIKTIEYVEKYIDKICNELSKYNSENAKKIISNLKSMKDRPASDLYDALQRVLFWNAMFHQTGSVLVGLGRLDKVLNRFNFEDETEAKSLISEFCRMIHKNFEYKSQTMLGDTGQLIILGGLNPDGSYFCNKYTYLFIDAVKEIHLPDPKTLLRVSNKTPSELLQKAMESIMSGNGSPLLSNDDVIIPLLNEYGYKDDDAYNYAVSACWEPVIVGKSLDQNNLYNYSFAETFVKTIKELKNTENLGFNDIIKEYNENVDCALRKAMSDIDKTIWEETPLMSIFFEDCITSGVDLANGGAKYNNYGILTEGLANTVNSFLNLERIVYKEKRMSLSDIQHILKNNYKNNDTLRKELLNSSEYFGQDTEKILELTNQLFGMCKDGLKDKLNRYNGKYKVGLSSPSYLIDGTRTGATFDGRMKNTPLATHISCDKNLAYTELLSFAAQLNYCENGFNGNVVDIMVTPNLISSNFEKFISLIKAGIKQGFFQMQMNVISSETLIDAKSNPDNYRNLIVRVWGFSAFYVDLPTSYKDMLIERALKNEGKIA